MRIGLSTIWIMITLQLVTTSAFGYKVGKRHKKSWTPNFYADFATIEDVASADGNENSKGCESDNKQCGGGNIKGFFGSGSPKEKSTNIAQKAAQEAKAANDAQAAAAQAAAQHIKAELAEKALQSAKAAEAALAGKQQIVEQLEQEVREAEAVVQEETSSLQSTEGNMNAALQAAHSAEQQYSALSAVLTAAKENLANTEQVANGAQQEMSQKTELLEAAKNRIELLNRQLASARQDFEKTKTAAYKAACAAVEAKRKASTRTRRKSDRQNKVF